MTGRGFNRGRRNAEGEVEGRTRQEGQAAGQVSDPGDVSDDLGERTVARGQIYSSSSLVFFRVANTPTRGALIGHLPQRLRDRGETVLRVRRANARVTALRAPGSERRREGGRGGWAGG